MQSNYKWTVTYATVLFEKIHICHKLKKEIDVRREIFALASTNSTEIRQRREQAQHEQQASRN
jgi:hypothetical protein